MNDTFMNIIIIFLIIILFFLDYYHDKYNLKKSIKKIYYRNSNSVYDDTDYSKYKPYKKIYTYKFLIGFLIIILIINFISNPKSFLKLLIILFQ